MRKLILISIFIAIISQLFAQTDRFWVNGPGNWHDQMHWSLVSGGEAGADIPNATNSVYIDENSLINSGDAMVIKQEVSINDLNITAPVTLKGKNAIEIQGSVSISKTAHLNKFKGDLVFASSSKQQITIPIKLNSNIVFNGKNGEWDLETDIDTRKSIFLDAGNLNTLDKDIKCYSFDGSGNESRSLNLGKSKITVESWNFTQTANLAFDAGKSEILIANDLQKDFLGGKLLYNSVSKAGAGSRDVITGFTNPDCPVNSTTGDKTNGTITAEVDAGTDLFDFRLFVYNADPPTDLVEFKEDENSVTFASLSANVYKLYIYERNIGTAFEVVDITLGPSSFLVDINVSQDVSCFGGSDLQLTAASNGGNGGYSYLWQVNGSGTPIVPNNNINTNDLGEGSYEVIVTDVKGCESGNSLEYWSDGSGDYSGPVEINISGATPSSSCVAPDNGEIDVTASGGTGILTYAAVITGGTPVGGDYGTNPIIGLAGAVTYDVWVKDDNDCEKLYGSVTVGLINDPVAPTSVLATELVICDSESTNLTYSGGSGTTFGWYTASCGGVLVGTGNNLLVTPTATTEYFGRWENSCNSSTCESVTITVNLPPTDATSASATDTDICAGESTTISYIGGTGTTFEWYRGTCGGTFENSGNDLVVSPTTTTTYYGRWENNCGNSNCVQVTINVTPLPVAPSSVSATATAICAGESTDLTFTGGSGTTFNWYTASCGGALVGPGNNLTVTPASTTTYYGRWENICDESTCKTVTITVSPLPTAPTTVDATSTTICEGQSTDLTFTGGSGDTFVWYTGSCGGTQVGTANNFTVSPTVTTEYFGRWETATCGESACLSVIINVNPLPITPTSVSATTTSICAGGSTDLTYIGGSGITFNWYTASCGGAFVGTGNNLTVSPALTTTYYGRWENTCGESTCKTVTITVSPLPTDPTTVDATSTTICEGQSTDLTFTGGSGDSFVWYTGSCGGTQVGTANNLTVFPTVTTEYFGRWETTTCGESACLSVVITVDPLPIKPTSVSATQTTICEGDNTTLSYTGGAGVNFEWYTASCGGTPAGSGNNVVVSPTVTTTYYGRWQNDCGNSICESITINVNPLPTDPTLVSATETTICEGESTNLTYTGGSGDTFGWYSALCGGTLEGNGNNLLVTPAATTTYYGRWETTSCGVTACQTVTIIVDPLPTAPTSLSATAATICVGESTDLSSTGGSGTTFRWYTSSCGGTLVGTGNPSTVSPIVTTTYYGRWENDCGNSTCETIEITVNPSPTAYAGVDTTLCRDAIDYLISDALASDITGISWENITTNKTDGFDDASAQNPLYTFTVDDTGIDTLELVMSVDDGICTPVNDTVLLIRASELVASVGGISPYLINNATTQITVSIWATHENVAHLGFYLQAPDGLTRVRLYKHYQDGGSCGLSAKPDIEELTFSTESTDSLDFCDGSIINPITGIFVAADESSWSAIDGLDPAEGGWSLVIEDGVYGKTGTLTKAIITFLDKNQQGFDQYIIFDSGDINYPIVDHSETTYNVPLGLRTNCFGSCDARAIVSVTGGTAPYVSYLWSDGQTGETVDLCGGDHTVTVTDSRGCESIGTVSVIEPDPIVVTTDSTNIFCYGDSTGMVKATGSLGAGTPYTYLWNDFNNSATEQVDNLPAGEYIVTVTDKNNCTTIDTVVITQPLGPIMVDNIVIDSTQCGIVDDGKITLAVSGGTPFTVGEPYLYEIDGISTLNPISGLAVGTYVISIIDSLGCPLDTTITMVDEGDMEITGFTMLQEVSCNGSCDGEVQVDFTGGTGTYSYDWTGGGLTGLAQSLPNVCGDSTYAVLITDISTSCSTTDFYSIPQPDTLQIIKVDSTMTLCYSDSSGTADVLGQGGTNPYTYTWTNAANDTIGNSASVTKLPYGYVYINITDFNLCSVDDSIFIDRPDTLQITSLVTNFPSACGLSDGTAEVNVVGGTAPYNYYWINSSSDTVSQIFNPNNLKADAYNLVIEDANSCAIDTNFVMSDNSSLTVLIDSIHNVTCYGAGDGAAFITVTGGVEPINYYWIRNGNDTISRDSMPMDLWFGNYVISVKDANNCSAFEDTVITRPDALTAINKIENEPLCFGSKDGSASVTPSGGTIPYYYAWFDGQTESIALGLGAGKHFVTITDFNGCLHIDSVTLTDPLPITFDFEFNPTNCGDSVGTINIANIAGGTGIGTYTTDWASPEWASYPNADSLSVDTIRNLWVANYVAIVTDTNACVVRDSMNMQDTSSMEIFLDTIINVTCNSGTNGSILVHGVMGNEPYTYLWDTADADSLLNDVAAGSYNVIVEDAEQCRRDTVFTIIEPDALINKWVFTDSIVCAGKDSASFYALISGGVAPYTYLWNDLDNSTDSNLVHAKPDTYTLTVVDANNCIFIDSIDIFEPIPIALAIAQGETACPDSLGWAKVIASGGVAPYTFNWYLESDPSQLLEGQSTDSISKLWVDIFVVQVTDSLGCVAYDTVIIEDNSGLDFNYTIAHHEWCPNSGDGKAFINLVTIPDSVNPLVNYTATWSDGFVGDTNSNLFVGRYTIIVQENTNGCKVIDTLVISAKDRLRYDKDSVMNFVKEGELPVGVAYLKPYGGDTTLTDKYYVTWYNDFAATDTIGATDTISVYGGVSSTDKYEYLDEGVYYVSLENNRADGKTCMLWDSIHITIDTLNYVILDSSDVYCYGGDNGFIEVNAIGGSKLGYTYAWNNMNWDSSADSTGNSITNLIAGIYYLTITDLDPRGGELIDSIVIKQPDSPYVFNFNIVTKPGCTDSTGVIAITEPVDQGGAPPYAYEWYYNNDTVANDTISNLWVNTYYLKVTDARGCEADSSIYLSDNSNFAIEAKASIIPICYGDTIGSVEVNIVQAGTEPYKYSWFEGNNTDTLAHSSEVTNIGAGVYHAMVIDSIGCVRFDSAEVIQYDKIEFSIADTVLNDCYTDSTGSFTFVNVNGGSGNGYTYFLIDSLGQSTFQSEPEFTEIPVHKYNLLVSAGQCYSDSIPFVFLSTSPQMIPTFEIIDSASCNNYTDDGKMRVEIEWGYFDQVSPTNVVLGTPRYVWDGMISDPKFHKDTLENALAGLHTVKVTDTQGCEETFKSRMPSKVTILLDSAYVLSSGLAEDYLCPNDTIQVFAMSTGYDSIVWNNQQYIVGDPRKSLVEVVSNTSKTFYPTAYYNGCRDVDTLLVGRYSVDTLMASSEDDEDKIFAGNEIKLMTNAPEVSYAELSNFDVEHKFTWTASHSAVEWNPSPPDSIAVFARPSESAQFTVHDSILITNLFYSNQVCYVMDTIGIIVLPDFDPPKGFSPNGDGSNDEWRLSGIDGYDNVSIQIYNRWGGIVWEHNGAYNANRWKGENSKGKPLPSGTYYYIVKYGDSNSGTKTLTGPITIVR